MRPLHVAIDFDGTIVEHEYPKVGPLKKDSVTGINLLKELGCYIIITSCRTSSKLHPGFVERIKQKQLIEEFLTENDILFDEVDDGSQGKVVADVYIDDHAIRFEDNWLEFYSIIRGIINRGNE